MSKPFSELLDEYLTLRDEHIRRGLWDVGDDPSAREARLAELRAEMDAVVAGRVAP